MYAEAFGKTLAGKAWNILVAFLFTFNMLFGTVPPVSAQEAVPTITTNKADYLPGETVLVTGANWLGDTDVYLVANDTIGQTWQSEVTVKVGEDGSISASFSLPSTFVAEYTIVAKGVQTGRQATATFTDAPPLTITKSASPVVYTAAGQVISYSYVVQNTGNQTATNIVVSDDKTASVSCPSTSLVVGASMTCTASYTTTAADITFGYVANHATATASGGIVSNTDIKIASIPVTCRNDSDGANDVTGQKDLTMECASPTAVNPEVISWNWDNISQTGANSADGCALFDTNNNGLANYALCVSWLGPRTMQAGYPVLYQCNDSKVLNCGQAAQVPITNGTACAVELANDDPFSAGDSYPLDTKAFCSINLADVGGASKSVLIDVCSYTSASPSSVASDCVVISTAKGNLQVIKSVVPDDPNTNWNISWTGSTPYSGTIAGSGTTGIQAVNAGSYNITEAAGTNTDMSLYDTTWACTVDGSPSTSGSGTTISGVSVVKGSVVICTFTNTRKTGTLQIKKDVIPDNSSTNWNFAVTGPTAFNCSIAGDGSCPSTAKTVFTGSYSITETAGSGTNLIDYGTSWACTVNGSAGPSGTGTSISGLTINKSDAVVCTFTNSQSPGTLTVNKVVVPSTDAGKFNLTIDGTVKVSDVGNGGTTGAVSVSAGSHTVGETAGTGTDLTNYVTAFSGDCDSSGNVSVSPNQSKTCTITNTRKGSIVIKKLTDPTGQAGDFTFSGAVSGTIQDGGTLTASNLTPGSYAVTETSLAADFSLESITCDDSNSSGDVSAKKANIVLDAGETVTCTFTNKKLNPNLAVTKTADAASVTAGDSVGFSISVKNNGAGTAYNVTLSDPLPSIPSVSWTIDPPVSGCSLTAGSPDVINCSFGNLAPGASAPTVHFTGTSAANSCGLWNNTATAQADNNGPVTASASILVDCATIKITKTAGSSPISAGDPISFTIKVFNDNTGTAHNVTVTDTLPTNAGLGTWTLSGADAGACSISGVLTCNFGDVAGHASKTVTLTTSTTAATCGPVVSNTASVTTSNDGQDSSTATITVQCPDLSVTKTPDAATVNAGDPVGFTITVHNAGPGVAKSVTLTDTLPAGLTWTVTTPSSGCSVTSGVLSCSLGNLASGVDATVHVAATSSPSTCGALTNETATATPTNGSAASSGPATVTVNCADVTVTKTGNGPVSAGDTATFTVTVKVTGSGSLSNVTLNDPLPAGVTWALDPSVTGCSINGTSPQTLSCSWATLDAPATIAIAVSGTTSQANCAAPLRNTATVAAANETDTTNDTANDSITVQCATIEIAKTAGSGTVSAGDPISYTITVTNPGAGIARNVNVTDTLPANSGLNWFYPAACTVSGGVLTCSLGDIAGNGGSKSITLTSPTTAATCGTVTNSASVTTTNDGTAASAPVTITVQCPHLSVTKTPDKGTVSAGDTIGYTITVSNAGPGEAKGVKITDFLPGDLAWAVDAANTTAAGCSIYSNTLTCGPDTIASGGSVKVHVTAASTPAVCGTLTNDATASPTNGDAATSSESTITVQCPDLTVTKTGNGPISAGDTATFTITVKNIGSGTARGVTISDNLPGGLTWSVDADNTTATGCSIAAGVLTCGQDTIASGGSVKVTVSAVTAKNNCGTLTNNASAAATNEANTSNNTSGDTDLEVDCATIQIAKTTSTPTVSAGDLISYTITVSNPGLGTAKDVSVTDNLPGGLIWSIDTAHSDAGCSISSTSPQALSCTWATLASGGSKTVIVTATTSAANCGTLTNTASVTTSNDGAATTPGTDITVKCPALAVTKTADAATISAGDPIGFTITVTNTGDGIARNVTLSDSLPTKTGIAWSIDPANSDCTLTGASLSCSFGDLASSAVKTVHITSATTKDSCGDFDNTATASAKNWSSVTSEASVTVQCTTIVITKIADQGPFSAGDTIGFRISVYNPGPGTAYGVIMTDHLPTNAGLNWQVSSQPVGNHCSISGGVLTCNYGTMVANTPNLVHITSTTTAAACGTVQNTASVTTTNDGSGSASDSLTVNCPDLTITKTPDAASVSAGNTIGFTMTVKNSGLGKAYGVTLTDTLPTNAGLDWKIDPAVTGCSITGGALTCDVGTLDPAATFSVHLSSPTTSATCGKVDNTATVTATNEAATDNNSATSSLTVNCPDLTVEKIGNGPINAGDTAVYTITITNSGAGDAAGVTLSDTLPAHIQWSVDNAACSIVNPQADPKVLSCSFGTLAAGDHITIHVSGTASSLTCGPLSNTANVAATNEAVTDNNNATGSVTVNCASISITKSAPSPISAGGFLSYTIMVNNNGDGTAYGATVTDTLPTNAGLGPWTVTPGQPTCTITGGVLTCNLGDLAAHSTQTISLSSPTTYDSCGTIFNEAGLTTTNAGATKAATNVDVQCPALKVTKTADADTVSAGDTIGFTITVTNSGDGVAKNVTLSDTLPTATGIAWSIASSDPTCALTGASLSCSFGDLAKGDTKTVHVTSPTTKDSCTIYENTATASADNQPSVTSSQASTEVLCTTIQIQKIADEGPFSPGDTIGFTINVSNPGPASAYGVKLTDTLPTNPGLNWQISAQPSGNPCSISGGKLTCDFGTMAANTIRSVRITSITTAATCGTVENEATVTTTNDGTGSAANSITVNCPDLTITKTPDAAAVSAGDTIGFTITATNSGLGKAYGVTLTDTLPTNPGTSWIISPAVTGCSITGSALTCDVGTLNSSATFSVHVSSPTTPATCGGKVDNTAAVTATNEAVTNNNSAGGSITVNCPGLTVTKAADAASVNAGDVIGFTITVSNAGPGVAKNVNLTDTLPSGSGISWNLAGGTGATYCGPITGGALTCSFGDMAAGASYDIHVTSPTDATSCGKYDNTAAVTSTNQADVTGTDSVAVNCASISITKTTSTPTVSAGEPIHYTIIVTNSGSGTAHGVTVTDTLPANGGLNWTVNPAVTGCSVTGRVLTCNLGDLAAKSSQTITLTSPTTYASCAILSNTASVTTSNDGSATSQPAIITVNCPALAVTKVADAATVSAGDAIGFTITVTNTGDGVAKNVSLSDTLPAKTGMVWSIAPANSDCTLTGTSLSCSFGDLAPGAVKTVHLASPTTKDSCDTFNNMATASADNQPPVTSTQASITVQCTTIEITKRADVTPVSAGDTLGFTITVTNPGPGAAYGVTLTDHLAINPGLDWSIDPAVEGCSIAGGILTCNYGTMAAGATKSVHVSSPTTAASCGMVPNTAYVTTTNDGGGSASDVISVFCPDVEVTKVGSAQVNAGDPITFEIQVENIGNGTAKNVVVTDTLPTTPGLNWSVGGPDASACSIAGGVVTCTFPTLAPNAIANITLTSLTTAASCTSISNTATITASNEPADKTGNNSSIASTTVNCPDVVVTKTAANTPVNAGDQISFQIQVTNTGLGTARDVVLTDTLPTTPGLSWTISGADSGACTVTSGVLTCGFASLPPDVTATITLTSPTTKDSCAKIDNTATATATNEPSGQPNNTSTASITVQCANLTITKSANGTVASAGQSIGFDIVVTNIGLGTAKNVLVTDTLPNNPGLDWSANIISQPVGLNGSCAINDGTPNKTLSCIFDQLTAGQFVTINVTSPTTFASCGTVTNTASVTSSNDGSATTEPAAVTINCPAIQITKTRDTSPISAGQMMVFTVTVKNTGAGTAKNVVVTDPMQNGSGVVWHIGPGYDSAACTLDGSYSLTCHFGDMAPNDTKVVRIEGSTNATSCGTYENIASVTGDNFPSQNAEASVVVNCPSLTMTKVGDPSVINAGETAKFVITIHNGGSGTAFFPVLTDVLPANYDTVTSVPAWDSVTYTPNLDGTTLFQANYSGLEAGGTITVTITMQPATGVCGTITNTANLAARNLTGSLQATGTITVNCPDVSVAKTAASSSVSAGDPLIFNITVTNTGAGTAKNVTLSDTLPTGTGLAWSIGGTDGAACSTASGVVSCDFGDLAPGATKTITLTSPTTKDSCATYNNTATATSTNEFTSLDNNSSKASITVLCASIEIYKTPDPNTGVVNAGDHIAFNISIINSGQGTAKNITVTDPLPVNPGLHWTLDSTSLPTGTNGSCSIDNSVTPPTLTCTFDQLLPGKSAGFRVGSPTTLATACQTINNTASVTTSNDGSAQASSAFTVTCAKIEIYKSPDPNTMVVSAGDRIAYNISILNTGASAASNVVVTDPLPVNPGLDWSLDSTSLPLGTTGSCTIDKSVTLPVLTCTFDQLLPGKSAGFRISSPTTYATCGTVENQASVTTSNDGTATSGIVKFTVNCPALKVTKTPDMQTVSAGEPISFTITVTNNGLGTAKNVTLSDQLPLGVTWIPNNSGCGVDANGLLTCGFNDLKPGDSTYVTVTGNSIPAMCGTFDNTATIKMDNGPDVTSNTVSATVNCPDVTVTKEAVSGTINAGDTAAFKIVVSNTGTGTASGVTLTDTLPAGLTWTIAPAVSECSIAGGILSCSWPSLAAGASVTINVSGPTSSAVCGKLDNTVTVAASNETNSTNNTASASIAVNCSDVTVTKEAVTGTINAGDTAAFKIVVANGGAGTAYNVTLTDTLPAGITWTIDPAITGCAITGNTLACSFTTLAAGASVTINVSGVTSAALCGTLTNTATVTASNEANTSNNSANASITVNCSDVTVTKEAVNGTINAGDTAAFKIVVSNTGAGTAYNVTVNDTLPAGITWVIDPAISGCSITGGTLSCSFTSLAAGASVNITVSGTAPAAACGTLDNTVTVAASNETNTTNNSAKASITVNCPDVKVTKTADNATTHLGQDAIFNIVVENIGAGKAYNVTLTDTLPGTVTWSLVQPVPGCTLTGSVLSCAWASLDPAAKITIQVKAAIQTTSQCTTLTNTAAVTAANEKAADTANNTSTATITVTCPADLTISKTVVPTMTREYLWDISKSADRTLVKQSSGSVTFNYTVTVAGKGYKDSNWLLAGQITVNNPNDWMAIPITSLTDKVDNGGTCTVKNFTPGDLVPAGGSRTYEYTCTYTSKPCDYCGVNTATANWDASVGTPHGTASVKVGFAFANGAPGNPTNINKTITVTDTYKGTLGTVTATCSGCTTKKFTYSRTIDVKYGCKKYDNTATIVETGQSASKTVTVCGPIKTGARTIGFWQNNNGQGLILNAPSSSGVCKLTPWLRQFAPFQDLSYYASCSKAATYVYNIIKAASASGATMNAMLKAQMLATALDVYFSDPALGGNKLNAPVPIGGVVVDLTTINNGGSSSSAFGGAKTMTVLQMLKYAASKSNSGGSTWYGNVKSTQTLAKNAFDAINNEWALAP